MARYLPLHLDMRTLGLLVAIVGLSFPVANAQDTDAPEGALIESVEVSGLSLDRLSPELRQDIDALVGEGLNRERVGELAACIEVELPELIVAVRNVQRPDGKVRVIFLVARISDDRDLATNINTRYIVDSVEISGVPDTEVSQELRDDLQALVGKRLDPDEAQRFHDRLAAELPGYHVRRRISRGRQSETIRVTFIVGEPDTPRWIRFAPSRSKFVRHSDLGRSGVLDIPMGGRDHRVTLGLVGDNDDDLIEEYSGYRVRLESRKVATERLGLSLEFSDFRQTWRDATLSAAALDPSIADVYRKRRTIEPLVTFAVSPRVRVTAGASVTELESLFQSPDSQMASTANFSIGYDQRWELASGSTHEVEASYELRATTTVLESDLDYERHLGRARYRYQHGRNTVLASVALGRLTGGAPLFERFSLGDSSTLRGWSKFDIAPVGGNQMVYHSLEYRHRGIAFFFDAGSVWDRGTDARLRLATGVGFHGDNGFLTVGFPLNATDLGAQFMAGVLF